MQIMHMDPVLDRFVAERILARTLNIFNTAAKFSLCREA